MSHACAAPAHDCTCTLTSHIPARPQATRRHHATHLHACPCVSQHSHCKLHTPAACRMQHPTPSNILPRQPAKRQAPKPCTQPASCPPPQSVICLPGAPASAPNSGRTPPASSAHACKHVTCIPISGIHPATLATAPPPQPSQPPPRSPPPPPHQPPSSPRWPPHPHQTTILHPGAALQAARPTR